MPSTLGLRNGARCAPYRAEVMSGDGTIGCNLLDSEKGLDVSPSGMSLLKKNKSWKALITLKSHYKYLQLFVYLFYVLHYRENIN